MAMNNTNFAYGLMLAEQEGVDRPRAVQLGLVASLMGSSILSAFVVQMVARNEAAASPTSATAATPPTTKPPGTTPGAPTRAIVPDVSDGTFTFATATTALKDVQLKAARYDVAATGANVGTVMGQRPKAGEEVAVGSTVTLGVGRAAAPVFTKVPKAVGETLADASKLVRDAKLTPNLVFALKPADVANDGKVVAQEPDVNSPLEEGEAVTLTVRIIKAP